jgi:catechol 2,3-dioxygenase-like lactoylglutathione lyase family enzyme
MPLLTIADSFYIGVSDIESATSWYVEKLGLQKVPAEMDDPEGCVALGFSKKDQTCIAVLGPRGRPTDEPTPMLYTTSIGKAREVLGSRGVNVGGIQEDRQGTHYFEMRDLEGNVIEISEEP